MVDDLVQHISNPGRTRSTQYRDIYSNVCNLRVGPLDMTMAFGQMVEGTPGTVVIEDQVSVTVSPQQMKALVRVMAETLQAYESSYGALSIPEDITRPKFSAAELSARFSEAHAAASATSASEQPQLSPRSRGASRKKD